MAYQVTLLLPLMLINGRNFSAHSHNPIVPLGQEFYDNILTVNQIYSMVRCIKVAFSASLTNMHFGLPDVVDEYSTLMETIYGVVLNKML